MERVSLSELTQVALDMLFSENVEEWNLREVCLGLQTLTHGRGLASDQDKKGEGHAAGEGNTFGQGWSGGSISASPDPTMSGWENGGGSELGEGRGYGTGDGRGEDEGNGVGDGEGSGAGTHDGQNYFIGVTNEFLVRSPSNEFRETDYEFFRIELP